MEVDTRDKVFAQVIVLFGFNYFVIFLKALIISENASKPISFASGISSKAPFNKDIYSIKVRIINNV